MTFHVHRVLVSTIIAGILITNVTYSQAQVDTPEGTSQMPYLNVPLPTMGGTQVWTDHRNINGWRLQQNVITGHWRLLDPSDIRRAWGDRESCQNKFPQLTEGELEAAAPKEVVILLHGLMRSKHSMRGLKKRLEACEDAPQVIEFSYASTRSGIADHAAALREVVESLPGTPKINFVGHSMGNIVVRHAIGDWQNSSDPCNVLSRLDRIVMIGPPNQGAAIARRLGKLGLFKVITGQGGMELGPIWTDLEARLATPPCPFAVIAGDLPSGIPQNPLVDGNSDFVVSVDEARLEGAEVFRTVPHIHSFMMDQQEVQDIVIDFLELSENTES